MGSTARYNVVNVLVGRPRLQETPVVRYNGFSAFDRTGCDHGLM